MFGRSVSLLVALLVAPSRVWAQDGGIGQIVNDLMQPITDLLTTVVFAKIPLFGAEMPWVVLWLIAGGIFFTFYFKFVSVRGLPTALRLLRGDYDDPDDPGEVSHFGALTAALSGTVGIGNIGGVAAAISIGGAGATLWMVLAGLLGMATKFCEATLGVKYRAEFGDGHVSGGPMYYLSRGLQAKGWDKLGKFLGAFYAVGIFIGCLGIGNMFQSNQAFEQFVSITGGPQDSWLADKGWLFGAGLALLVAAVIIGGIKSIANVTEKLVPAMALLYISAGMVVLAINVEAIGWTYATIFADAFRPEAVGGGMIGAMIVGFQRAAFSNEAGLGSAAIAHAAVKTHEPITEGLVAAIGPFLDTVIICALTATVVVSTGYFHPGFYDGVGGTLQGVATTSAAFGHAVSWFPYVIAVAAMLFAFSSIIAWGYYGLKGWTYLFGESKRNEMIYKAIYCVFVALGCVVQLGAVLDFSDAMVFVIAVPNILGMYILAPEIKHDLEDYFRRIRSGEIRNFRQEKLDKG